MIIINVLLEAACLIPLGFDLFFSLVFVLTLLEETLFQKNAVYRIQAMVAILQ